MPHAQTLAGRMKNWMISPHLQTCEYVWLSPRWPVRSLSFYLFAGGLVLERHGGLLQPRADAETRARHPVLAPNALQHLLYVLLAVLAPFAMVGQARWKGGDQAEELLDVLRCSARRKADETVNR